MITDGTTVEPSVPAFPSPLLEQGHGSELLSADSYGLPAHDEKEGGKLLYLLSCLTFITDNLTPQDCRLIKHLPTICRLIECLPVNCPPICQQQQ